MDLVESANMNMHTWDKQLNDSLRPSFHIVFFVDVR